MIYWWKKKEGIFHEKEPVFGVSACAGHADGGGSACCLDKDGNGFAGDGRYIPFYLILKLKETDNEPKGGKPMECEVKAYSLAKEGTKYLTKNLIIPNRTLKFFLLYHY